MGKGSRQRTFGATFNDNFDKIFGKKPTPEPAAQTCASDYCEEIAQPDRSTCLMCDIEGDLHHGQGDD